MNPMPRRDSTEIAKINAGGRSGPEPADGVSGSLVALIPRINVQAFCDTQQVTDCVQSAFADRRMARVHGTVMTGCIPGAIRLYQSQPTPNLLIVESASPREELLAHLGELAEVCQPDTKVVVVGQLNDVILYRELVRRGVSEYLVSPIAPLQLVEAISVLYRSERAAPIGRVVAFMGVKGGTGSSTIAHNCAWEVARAVQVDTTIVDLDIAFGTAALGFNIDAPSGVLEALSQPERVDPQLLDRLLVQVSDRLNLLGGPGVVDRDFVIEAHAVETILTTLRASVPMIFIDMPSIWTPWAKFTLLHADQVILTAEPDLASLRNVRALAELLSASRPNDPPPLLVLNQVGKPKRPESAGKDFRKAVGIDVAATIPFEPQSFGTALNNGRMLMDMAPRSKAADALRRLAQAMVGEKAARPAAPNASLFKRILGGGRK